jgi:hypothetical protein
MCLICVHVESDKMTVEEGYSALSEMQADIEPEHAEEVESLLYQKFLQEELDSEELEELEDSEELDFMWATGYSPPTD